MSKIEHIFLSYQEKKEKINVPKNYEELKLSFSEKFIKESPKNLKFNYIQEQKLIPIEQTNFSEAIETITKNREPYIYVEDDKFKLNLNNMNGLFLANENINLENEANGSELIIEENISLNNKIKNKESELINSSKENNIDSLNNLKNILKHKNEGIMQENIKLKTEINNYNSIKIDNTEENKNKIKDSQIEKMNCKIKLLEAKVENLENNENKKSKTMFLKSCLNFENKKNEKNNKIKSQSLSARKKRKKLKLKFINQYYQKEKNSLINKRKKSNINENKIKDEQIIKKIKIEQTRLKIQLNKKKFNNKNKEFEEYKIKTEQTIISLNKQIEVKDINLNKKNEIIKDLKNELNQLKELQTIQLENQGEIKYLKNQLIDINKIITEKELINGELKNKIKSLENELNNKIKESKNEKEKNELLINKYKNKIECLQTNLNALKEKYELNKKEFCNALMKKAEISIVNGSKEIKKIIDDVQNIKRNLQKKIEIYENLIKNSEKNKIHKFYKNNIKNKNNLNKNNNIINNYIFHNNNIFEKDKYSFKCMNQNDLQKIIVLEKSKYLNMGIAIENNGKNKWPSKRTKLAFNKDSNLIGEDIILQPQNPGEIKKYQINISELETYPYSIYAAELIFKVDEKPYGEKINLNIEIINEEKKEKLEKIEEFRKIYSLPREHYSDKDILNALEKNKNDLIEAYNFLFKDCK